MKVNFDGACFPKSDEAGIRMVVRNSDGEVMATMAEKIAKPPLVEVLKVVGSKAYNCFHHGGWFSSGMS